MLIILRPDSGYNHKIRWIFRQGYDILIPKKPVVSGDHKSEEESAMGIRMIEYHNKGENTIDRPTYRCVRVRPNFAQDAEEWDFICEQTQSLVRKLNPTEANNGEKRDSDTQYKDALAGVIAEVVSMRFLNFVFGSDFNVRPQAHSAVNQIDLETSRGQTIEVRSSFVRNGVSFALFAKNPKTGRQYFDIIGPYHNPGYKVEDEICKDYFFRVLYEGCKEDFSEKAALSRNFEVYLVGGVNRAMMQDPAIRYSKYMIPPKDDKKAKKGEYSAVTIGKSLDIAEFVQDISKSSDIGLTESYRQLEARMTVR